MRVALATALELSHPDTDLQPLVAALRALGADAEVVPWNGPQPKARFDVVVLRSTWGYWTELPKFQGWLEQTAAESRLLNPLSVVQWNLHKRYLLELSAKGVPVVPTGLVAKGGVVPPVEAFMSPSGVVVKPAVAGGSFGTKMFRDYDAALAREHVALLSREGDVLVQPYQPEVEDEGERSLIFIAGELSHVMRKQRRLDGEGFAATGPFEATEAEREVARLALEGLPPLLYARVDMVKGPAETPRLMELELTEPFLFLGSQPGATEKLAKAILAS